MICPVCQSQMIKSKTLSKGAIPGNISCVQCNFTVYYKGIPKK